MYTRTFRKADQTHRFSITNADGSDGKFAKSRTAG